MKKFPIAACVFACALAHALEYKVAKISDGKAEADVCVDVSRNGYYRGMRFSPDGIVFSLNVGGHVYFGSRHDIHSPDLHDGVSGPVEEFLVVGYDDAKAGGDFLKIGVGILERIDAEPYNFRLPHKIKNAGERSVKVQPDRVEYVHKLSDKSGYGYVLKKTLLLDGNGGLKILCSLKNTGTKKIDSNVYNHNFFTVDNAPVDESVVVKFAFEPKAEFDGLGANAKIDGTRIRFLRRLSGEDRASLVGIGGGGVSANDMSVEFGNVGAGVRVRCDKPLLKAVFWSDKKTVCPEPFVKISLSPNEETSWSWSYDFYNLK